MFSSSHIHKARVLSVSWSVSISCSIYQAPHGLHFRLGEDTLMSHSAPALMRRIPDNVKDVYEEKGTVVIWHWLSLNRFFPPNMKYQRILRGCASVSVQTLEGDTGGSLSWFLTGLPRKLYVIGSSLLVHSAMNIAMTFSLIQTHIHILTSNGNSGSTGLSVSNS